MSLDEIADCVPSLSLDELRELEDGVMRWHKHLKMLPHPNFWLDEEAAALLISIYSKN